MRQYKSILLQLNNTDVPADNVGIKLARVKSRQTHGSVIGDTPPPTSKEISPLIFNDDPETREQ